MPFWQRALILLVAMAGVGFIFGTIWHALFSFYLPGYVTGVVCGLTAVPLWDLLKRTKPKK
jgi:hypothetical protein